MQANFSPSPFFDGAITSKDAWSHASEINLLTALSLTAGFPLNEKFLTLE